LAAKQQFLVNRLSKNYSLMIGGGGAGGGGEARKFLFVASLDKIFRGMFVPNDIESCEICENRWREIKSDFKSANNGLPTFCKFFFI
jgi:hypothetical protein